MNAGEVSQSEGDAAREPSVTKALRLAHTLGASIDELAERIYWNPGEIAAKPSDRRPFLGAARRFLPRAARERPCLRICCAACSHRQSTRGGRDLRPKRPRGARAAPPDSNDLGSVHRAQLGRAVADRARRERDDDRDDAFIGSRPASRTGVPARRYRLEAAKATSGSPEQRRRPAPHGAQPRRDCSEPLVRR